MRLFLLLGLTLIAGLACAQGDSPTPFCYQTRDNTCDGANQCATYTFTVNQSGDANFKCVVGCSNGVNPSHCKITTYLQKSGSGTVYTCDNWDGVDCWDAYTQEVTIAVLEGEEYTLKACLEECDDDCCGNCRAVATFYMKHATCPAP